MKFKDYVKQKPKKASKSKPLKEDYENPHRFDWGTPKGTAYMQKMTPNAPIECVTPHNVWSDKLGRCVPVREAYINNEIFKLDEIVESTNGDIGPIVFRGSTYVTMKLESGKTVKHWINDIAESKGTLKIETKQPEITYKKKFSEQKLAALLMSREQLEEMTKRNSELEYDGYKTSFLYTCPGASAQLKELIKKPLNPKYISQAIRATDAYLEIESYAKKRGFADDKIIHDFLEKFTIAHDTLNMLGYPDRELSYMEGHLSDMSKLFMHKDYSFVNEPQSTISTYGLSDVSEGKKSMTHNYTKFRKKVQELYEPDPPTHNRDINFSPDKDVFHGIDKPMVGIGHPGQPEGMVSFKTFWNEPMNRKIAAEHEKDRQDVHRAQLELGTQTSPAYKQMRKARLQLEP